VTRDAGDEARRDQPGPEEVPHIVGGHLPRRRVRDSGRDLLERPVTVGVLGDPVEKFRELDEVPVALDEPLPIGEARPRHLAHELNVPGARRAFGHVDHRGRLPCVPSG